MPCSHDLQYFWTRAPPTASSCFFQPELTSLHLLPFYFVTVQLDAQPCRNRVCLLAGHLAGHMEDSRTPAFSTNPVLLSGRRAMVTPVPMSAGRCPPRARLSPTGHPRLCLGRLCDRLCQYHNLSALRRESECGRSGCCDGHSLPTGFPEITFGRKAFFAWHSACVSIMCLSTALQNVILEIGCV